jgi:hypothetical protein
MTLSEQAGVLSEALVLNLIETDKIIRWADEKIIASAKPPEWLRGRQEITFTR